MQIALSTDEWYPLNQYVKDHLINNGHTVKEFGSYLSQKDESWVDCTLEAAKSVACGESDEGIFFCWSGTGACIAANKIKGVRAALCWDSETAKLSRIWNHANVLVLPNRILSEDLIDQILTAWFEPYDLTTIQFFRRLI